MKTFLQFTEETLQEAKRAGPGWKIIKTVSSLTAAKKEAGKHKGAKFYQLDNDPNNYAIAVPKKVNEARQSGLSSTGYVLYHNTYSAAVQHALDFVKKNHGLVVDEDDYFTKVTTGPKKPSRGKTNSFNIELVDARTGNPSRKRLHMQVYNNDDKNYELNMYVS